MGNSVALGHVNSNCLKSPISRPFSAIGGHFDDAHFR